LPVLIEKPALSLAKFRLWYWFGLRKRSEVSQKKVRE